MKIIKSPGKPIKAWIEGVPIESAAFDLMRGVASLPFIFKHVAMMPDAHVGVGACIGSVVAMRGAICPSLVGVDIGCGMKATKTSLKRSDLPDTGLLRENIEDAIPHGRTNHGKPGDKGAYATLPKKNKFVWDNYFRKRLEDIAAKNPGAKGFNTYEHLGTLGSGNHFIEICVDTDDYVWIMLHSGSRGIGNRIGMYFIKKAREVCEKQGLSLPSKDLSYFTDDSKLFAEYIEAATWAQDFATENRNLMYSRVEDILGEMAGSFQIQFEANCHHNYVSLETHFGEECYVTRKGAVSADVGEWVIIPGSMGAKSFIGKGTGNEDSYKSCAHGAGRRCSRTQAKKEFTVEDHLAATKGVECDKSERVLDETPGAYKDIDAVMLAQSDLVEPVFTLKQIICVKG